MKGGGAHLPCQLLGGGGTRIRDLRPSTARPHYYNPVKGYLSLVNEYITKMCCIHAKKYYSTLKRRNFDIHHHKDVLLIKKAQKPN